MNFTTSSVLKFTPNWRQDGRRLLCLAYNPGITAAAAEGGSLEEALQTAIARLPEEGERGEEERDSAKSRGKSKVANLKSQSTTTTTTSWRRQSSIKAAAAASKLVASDSLLLDIKCKWCFFFLFLFLFTLLYITLHYFTVVMCVCVLVVVVSSKFLSHYLLDIAGLLVVV